MKRDEKIRQASLDFAKKMSQDLLKKAIDNLMRVALKLHSSHIDDEVMSIIDAYNSVIADLHRKTGVKMPNYPRSNYVAIIIEGKEHQIFHGGLLPKIDTPININPDSYACDEIKSAWSQLREADIFRQGVCKRMADKLNKMKRLPSISELTHEKLLEIWGREE